MTSSVSSPEAVVNLALTMIGYKVKINNMFEGTPAANAALQIYAQTRDELLSAEDWPFAFAQTAGVAAPVPPPQEWNYAYVYPANCLRVRYVAPSVVPFPNWNPAPLLWGIYTNSQNKVVVSQSSPVSIHFIAQVINPTLWTPLFVGGFAALLAQKLLPMLDAKAQPVIDASSSLAIALSSGETSAPDGDRIMSPRPATANRG